MVQEQSWNNSLLPSALVWAPFAQTSVFTPTRLVESYLSALSASHFLNGETPPRTSVAGGISSLRNATDAQTQAYVCGEWNSSFTKHTIRSHLCNASSTLDFIEQQGTNSSAKNHMTIRGSGCWTMFHLSLHVVASKKGNRTSNDHAQGQTTYHCMSTSKVASLKAPNDTLDCLALMKWRAHLVFTWPRGDFVVFVIHPFGKNDPSMPPQIMQIVEALAILRRRITDFPVPCK